ncbi:hypothetical protein ACS0TY_020277 [Phlomoides rotata]
MAKSKLILYISLISFLSLVKSTPNIGFTTDLIHRDSPQSPSYNPSLTPFQPVLPEQYINQFRSKIIYSPQSPSYNPSGAIYKIMGQN